MDGTNVYIDESGDTGDPNVKFLAAIRARCSLYRAGAQTAPIGHGSVACPVTCKRAR